MDLDISGKLLQLLDFQLELVHPPPPCPEGRSVVVLTECHLVKTWTILFVLVKDTRSLPVLWIQIHCIWIRNLKFSSVWIRIQVPVRIRIRAISHSNIINNKKLLTVYSLTTFLFKILYQNNILQHMKIDLN